MRHLVRKKLVGLVAATALLFWPVGHALANTGLSISGRVTGQEQLPHDLPTVIGGVIGILLGLVGVIFFAFTVYAGILWMTASGNEEQVTKARRILLQSVVGLAIVFAAYAITQFAVLTIGLEDSGSWTMESPAEGHWTATDEEGNIIMEGDDLESMIGEESEEDVQNLLDSLAE